MEELREKVKQEHIPEITKMVVEEKKKELEEMESRLQEMRTKYPSILHMD